MKEAFTIFDPTEHVDFVTNKIIKLESNNILLIVCLVAVVCVAGYYAYQYYQLKDDLN
jgi:hypothetical protein